MDTSELAVRVRGLGVLLGLCSPQYSKYVGGYSGFDFQ